MEGVGVMRRFLAILGSVMVLTGLMLPVLAVPGETFTLCHAAGQEGTTQFTTLTLPFEATFGQAGHFNEDGTPQAGHEQDYLGECIVDSTTTTTMGEGSTTTLDTGTTTTLGTTTTFPTPGLFAFSVVATTCENGEVLINITFPARPDLDGQVGTLTFEPVGEPLELTFISGATVQVFYPATTEDLTLTYTLGDETATATVTFPEDCVTTTTVPDGGTTVPDDDSTTTTFSTTVTTGPSTLPFTGISTELLWAAGSLLGLGGLTLAASKRQPS